ncbi:MAG: tetratricopeptide repeat protein [Myxococcota bacterium]
METQVRWRDDAGAEADSEFLNLLLEGSHLLQQGDVVTARARLEQALRLRPQNEKGRNLLGQTYFKMGLLDPALRIYRQLVEEYPGEPTLRLNLALVLLKKGDLQGARSQLEQVFELKPDHQKALNYLGLVYERLGELALARWAFIQSGSEKLAQAMEEKLRAKGLPLEPAQVPGRPPAPPSTPPPAADVSLPPSQWGTPPVEQAAPPAAEPVEPSPAPVVAVVPQEPAPPPEPVAAEVPPSPAASEPEPIPVRHDEATQDEEMEEETTQAAASTVDQVAAAAMASEEAPVTTEEAAPPPAEPVVDETPPPAAEAAPPPTEEPPPPLAAAVEAPPPPETPAEDVEVSVEEPTSAAAAESTPAPTTDVLPPATWGAEPAEAAAPAEAVAPVLEAAPPAPMEVVVPVVETPPAPPVVDDATLASSAAAGAAVLAAAAVAATWSLAEQQASAPPVETPATTTSEPDAQVTVAEELPVVAAPEPVVAQVDVPVAAVVEAPAPVEEAAAAVVEAPAPVEDPAADVVEAPAPVEEPAAAANVVEPPAPVESVPAATETPSPVVEAAAPAEAPAEEPAVQDPVPPVPPVPAEPMPPPGPPLPVMAGIHRSTVALNAYGLDEPAPPPPVFHTGPTSPSSSLKPMHMAQRSLEWTPSATNESMIVTLGSEPMTGSQWASKRGVVTPSHPFAPVAPGLLGLGVEGPVLVRARSLALVQGEIQMAHAPESSGVEAGATPLGGTQDPLLVCHGAGVVTLDPGGALIAVLRLEGGNATVLEGSVFGCSSGMQYQSVVVALDDAGHIVSGLRFSGHGAVAVRSSSSVRAVSCSAGQRLTVSLDHLLMFEGSLRCEPTSQPGGTPRAVLLEGDGVVLLRTGPRA